MASLLKAAMLGKRKKCYARKQTPLVKKRNKNKKPKHSSPQTRSEEEKIVNFTTWCEQVGLKLHPNVSSTTFRLAITPFPSDIHWEAWLL